MSTQNIIKEILDENLLGAKKEIEDVLYAKLGERLTEAYKEIAPSILTDDVEEIGGEMKPEYAKSDKMHGCANVVEHPEWGEGECITEMHAEPDENGFVEWYDVKFSHGIEEQVLVSEMKVVSEMNHTHGGKKKKKMTEATELDPVGKEDDDIDNDGKKNTKRDKYLKNRRKAVGKAMRAKNSGSEGY